jgi:hypothetical protein
VSGDETDLPAIAEAMPFYQSAHQTSLFLAQFLISTFPKYITNRFFL